MAKGTRTPRHSNTCALLEHLLTEPGSLPPKRCEPSPAHSCSLCLLQKSPSVYAGNYIQDAQIAHFSIYMLSTHTVTVISNSCLLQIKCCHCVKYITCEIHISASKLCQILHLFKPICNICSILISYETLFPPDILRFKRKNIW